MVTTSNRLPYEMENLNHLRIDEVYDADSNGELEDPSASGDAWRVQRVYVNGPGQLGEIAKVIVFTYASATTNTVASEDVYYYHYDILGNVSVISDSASAEADQFEQDAFGNLVSGGWSTRIGGITEQITTKQYDADLGLYYFNARWYDAQVGAFVSRDEFKDNRGQRTYFLADDSPTWKVDPSGNCFYLAKNRLPLHGILVGGTHPALVEETTVGTVTSHFIAELWHTDADSQSHPDGDVGYYVMQQYAGKYNGTTGKMVGTYTYEDITEYCLPGCLSKGKTCNSYALMPAVCGADDGPCNAYTNWTNITRPYLPGPPRNRNLNMSPWGHDYDFLRHNSHHYINCLLDTCCPCLPCRFTNIGTDTHDPERMTQGCEQTLH